MWLAQSYHIDLKKLVKSPKRYSLHLFFTNANEPTTYEGVASLAAYLNLKLAMEFEMNSISEFHIWEIV